MKQKMRSAVRRLEFRSSIPDTCAWLGRLVVLTAEDIDIVHSARLRLRYLG